MAGCSTVASLTPRRIRTHSTMRRPAAARRAAGPPGSGRASAALDAALAQGADLPFACKGGVCCTCKAKLIEGEIEMEVNYGLEPDEVEAGFILTCQSHPRSEKVRVDFDVK